MAIGIRMTISISKIKKIIARRKNRVENGIRALEVGIIPHSKGLAFSASRGGVYIRATVRLISSRGRVRYRRNIKVIVIMGRP